MSRFWLRVRTSVWLACYSVGLLLLFDVLYSVFLYEREPSPRAQVHQFSHGLVPNFAGFRSWGTERYPFYTNNLGFRDSTPRQVALKGEAPRILLIGDSFTEGLGVTFEQSFAGRLQHAGQVEGNRIEFLNAGVMSYSPIIYFRKIEWLLQCGLEFDEVIVFPDLSDVADEATDYFYLETGLGPQTDCKLANAKQRRGRSRALVITNGAMRIAQHYYKRISGSYLDFQFRKNRRPAWTIAEFDVGESYAPLGVQGGIERSRRNMQRLARMLAAREIPLSVVVYPWPMQLAQNDRNSRHVALWQEFCAEHCERFINTFPMFFAVRDSDPNWYDRLFIYGDAHYSAEGNRLVFEAVSKYFWEDGHSTTAHGP